MNPYRKTRRPYDPPMLRGLWGFSGGPRFGEVFGFTWQEASSPRVKRLCEAVRDLEKEREARPIRPSIVPGYWRRR